METNNPVLKPRSAEEIYKEACVRAEKRKREKERYAVEEHSGK